MSKKDFKRRQKLNDFYLENSRFRQLKLVIVAEKRPKKGLITRAPQITIDLRSKSK